MAAHQSILSENISVIFIQLLSLNLSLSAQLILSLCMFITLSEINWYRAWDLTFNICAYILVSSFVVAVLSLQLE